MKQRWGLVGLGLLALGICVLLPLLGEPLLLAYRGLKHTFGFLVDLLGIGAIAFVVGAFLAPLEALGWWAGWYGEGVEETEPIGFVERPLRQGQPIVRYIVYLDGIGQATYRYLPDVEEFLDRLEACLPQNMVLIRGILPYSVLNLPLTEDRPFAWLWRIADSLQVSRYGSLMGTLTSFLINLRNVLIVTVSADGRYGPIYNRGMSQVIYDSLKNHHYKPGLPVTLVGFSGGGQIALGALPFLKRSLQASIEVISIAGVISGNARIMQAEHLYHLVGDRDPVERLGPIFFPRRWKWAFLSNWNRAKRVGKISFFCLGPVGHSGAGGVMDTKATLPDGRTHLQQTLDLVSQVITDAIPLPEDDRPRQPSNYDRYWAAEFNRPDHYPIQQSLDENYRPIAPWMGRLILPRPEQRPTLRGGVWFEVHHTPEEFRELVGQTLALRWSGDPWIQRYVQLVTRNVLLNDQAKYSSRQGNVHPTRLDRWRQVDPLESLAGAHPNDDVIVLLRGVTVMESSLRIDREPVQITGRYYALVTFRERVGGSDRFRVVHFDRQTRRFTGAEEIVRLPQVIPDKDGICNSSNQAIEHSPLNSTGWFIYGAQDHAGVFTIQAIAPRDLLRLQPDAIVPGRAAAYRYLKQKSWNPAEVPKGTVKSILLNPLPPHLPTSPPPHLPGNWQPGDRALLVHNYGGIGGKRAEPPAKGPVYFGHFAYGVGRVVREPLSDELCWDIRYYQVYTQNTDGLIAGVLHWSRFLGDRQYGWAGVRPTCDLLIKLEAFTEPFVTPDKRLCALDGLLRHLSIMTARYRTGDGTGGTYVGVANNCAQDSNQALYATIRSLQFTAATDFDLREALMQEPGQTDRLKQLIKLGQSLKRQLLPFGAARADWQRNSEVLGLSLEDDPFENLFRGLISWRTIFPRVASDTIAYSFLRQGATIWVLRTSQVGGHDPDVEPVPPTTLPG